MSIALWIAAGLLAALFLAAGMAKMFRPKEELQERMVWAEDFTANEV